VIGNGSIEGAELHSGLFLRQIQVAAPSRFLNTVFMFVPLLVAWACRENDHHESKIPLA
jgi:hypothetical protein